MAITNAQQYQQLVNKSADGKRPGYRGDAAYSSKSEQSSKSVGGQGNVGSKASFGDSDRGGAPSPGDTGGSGGYEKNFTDQFGAVGSSPTSTGGPRPPEPQPSFFDQILGSFSNRRKQLYNLATGFLPGSKQSITTARKAYADYLEQLGLTPSKELLDTTNLYDYFDTQAFEKNLKPADASMEAPMSYGDFIAEKFGMPGVKYSGDVGGLEMYVAERDPTTGKPTKYGYRETRDGRNGEPVPPLTPYQKDVVEDEVDPDSLEGILANRIAYRFMANGGRAGYQQGGEIMPRLNQLGSGVSSAEQTLQQINQRLESAESSLGGGGAMQQPVGSGFMQPAGFGNRPLLSATIDPNFKPVEELKAADSNNLLPGTTVPTGGTFNGQPLYDKDGFGLGDQRYGTGLVGGPQMALPENPMSGGPMQSPLASAMRNMAADGGMMGRQMYQRGGIMEVAPRQGALFGGLKKAVSSALGSAKKILKSPIGKAAALYFAPALIPGGAKTLGGVFQNMGGLSGITSSLFANPATYQQKLMGVEKGFFPGLMDKFSNMGKLGKMSTMFGIGTLGGGALAALDAAGAGETDIKDVEALKAYLKSGYLKLNPDKSEQDAEAFAEANTVEYRANGGRIGFADGMPKEKFLSFEEAKAMNPGMFSAEVETNVVSPNTELLSYIKRIKSAAEKGTIPMDFALDLIKQKTKEQGVNLQDLRDDMMERTKEAYGGRIMRAYGDVVDQASGIMGLPQRVNQAGVKELDLRDSGGFIPPVGVKEKADDIPAMLSNNEFVFTADAVRGMGNGNVNKGAQRMYDMMKKLENGGRV